MTIQPADYTEWILKTTKNLILVIHDLGRIAPFEEIKDAARTVYPDLEEKLSQFGVYDPDPLLGFFRIQSTAFNIVVHKNRSYISLFREYNYIYGRFGMSLIDQSDFTRENMFVNVSNVKYKNLIRKKEKPEYEFAKVTLTVLDMIKVMYKAFPKGNCLSIQMLYDYSIPKFTTWGQLVLNFCATVDDEPKGLRKFLSYFNTVFRLEVKPDNKVTLVHLDREKYKVLEMATEMDTIYSFLGLCTTNEFLISKVTEELERFMKRAKIAIPLMDAEAVTELLKRRADFFVPGNNTVRYIPAVQGKLTAVEVYEITRFFLPVVKTAELNFEDCHELIYNKREDLHNALKGIDSIAIASRLYARSDWYSFKNGYISPAKIPSHNFIHLNLEIVPAEVPAYLEEDPYPDPIPQTSRAKGVIYDVGVRSATISAREIVGEEYDLNVPFTNHCFCHVNMTKVNGTYVSDFSVDFEIGDFVDFTFHFNEIRSPDRPLYFNVTEMEMQKPKAGDSELSEDDALTEPEEPCEDVRSVSMPSSESTLVEPDSAASELVLPVKPKVAARRRYRERIKQKKLKQRLAAQEKADSQTLLETIDEGHSPSKAVRIIQESSEVKCEEKASESLGIEDGSKLGGDHPLQKSSPRKKKKAKKNKRKPSDSSGTESQDSPTKTPTKMKAENIKIASSEDTILRTDSEKPVEKYSMLCQEICEHFEQAAISTKSEDARIDIDSEAKDSPLKQSSGEKLIGSTVSKLSPDKSLPQAKFALIEAATPETSELCEFQTTFSASSESSEANVTGARPKVRKSEQSKATQSESGRSQESATAKDSDSPTKHTKTEAKHG